MSIRSGGPKDDDEQIVDLQAKAKEDVESRSCLICTRKFKSNWRGNRICKRCKVLVRKRQGSIDEHKYHG